MSDDSSSINEFAEYLNNEGCDGKRFADFVLKKAGGTRPHRIFPDVYSDSDSSSFNVQLEKITTPLLETATSQEKPLNAATVANEIIHDTQPSTAPRNVHNVHSPTKKSGGRPHSDNLRRYSLKRLTSVRKRRQLIKEFESTLNEVDFDPHICSTPMNTRQDSENNQSRQEVNEKKSNSNCHTLPTHETAPLKASQINISISDNLMCCLHNKDDELKKLLNDHINAQQDSNKSNCANCSNKSIATDSPKLQRTFNIEKGTNPGEIILSPVHTTLQECQQQQNLTQNTLTGVSTRGVSRNNLQPNRTYNLTLRAKELRVLQESKNNIIQKENISNAERNVSNSLQNIEHLNNLNQSSSLNYQNIVDEDEVVIPQTQECENPTRNISTRNKNSANTLNTLKRSSIHSQRNRDITTHSNIIIPETQNITRNLSKVSFDDRNVPDHSYVVNKSSHVNRRNRNGSVKSLNLNTNTRLSKTNVETNATNVFEKSNLNNLLTDDENESVVEQEICKKDSSSAPLNLASRRLRPRHSIKAKQMHVGIPIAHPLKLEAKKTGIQSLKQKIPLNKAPNTPINGEKFADEIKSQLVRLTNNEILDLRKRNSLGKIYTVNSTNLTKQQELKEKQQLLEKEIENELRNRSLHYVSNKHSRHVLNTSSEELSNTYVELFSVPDVFKDVNRQNKSIQLSNTEENNIERRFGEKDRKIKKKLTVKHVILNNVDTQNKGSTILNGEELRYLCSQEDNDEILIPDTQHKECQLELEDMYTKEHTDEILIPDTQNKEGPILNAVEVEDVCTQKDNTEIVIPETQNKEGSILNAVELEDVCIQKDNTEIVIPDTQNKDCPILNAVELEDVCTQKENIEIEIPDTQNQDCLSLNNKELEDMCAQEKNAEINAGTQDKNIISSNEEMLTIISSQEDKNEFLAGNKSDLNQISFLPRNEIPSNGRKNTKKTKNKKRQISEETQNYITIKERLKKRPKNSFSKRSLYSKGFSDSENSDVTSFQNECSIMENNSSNYIPVATVPSTPLLPPPSTPSLPPPSTPSLPQPSRPSPPSLEIAAGSVPKSTKNDDEIFRKPVAPAPKTRSKIRKPIELPTTTECTSENDQTVRRSKRGHVPLKTTTPYVRMLKEMMEKSELAKNKRVNTTKTDAQKTSTYSMNSNDLVPIASSTVNTKSKRSKNIVIKNNINPKKKQKKQNQQEQQQTPSLLGDTDNVNTTGESTESRNLQLRSPDSEPNRVLLDDEYPTSSIHTTKSNQGKRNKSPIYEFHHEVFNEHHPTTPTYTKNSNQKECMSPISRIGEEQHNKVKSGKNKKSKVNENKKNLESSHIEFNPAPVSELNSIFDRLKHESTVESQINSQTKTCVIRVQRLKIPAQATKNALMPKSVSNTATQSNIAVATTCCECPNTYPQSDGELLSWLKGLRDIGNPFGNEKMFTEMHCSAAGNLLFTDLEGIDYAFYDTEEKASLGYLRFKPKQIKPLKRAKKFHLHFVVLSGKFKISTNKDQGEFKMGDMIAINKGTRYEIRNNADEIGILMVIKK
ncbi:protein PF14_0175 [Teleopsis dalmanni]|uniref:protein PF14_0175 n=1 Tax=Teleopsis dalmanni TaxID=139649 RepID=UPI0018CEFE74|nr:protein PF14_0175 [Teleopsis dalmanni]